MSHQNAITTFFNHVTQLDSPAPLSLFKKELLSDIYQRLQIYQDNIRGAFHEALKSAYPATYSILGDAHWQRVLLENVDSFTTGAIDINLFGHELPIWLRNFLDSNKQLQPYYYLVELAKLEWSVHQAHFVADDPEFNFENFSLLEQLSPEASRLVSSHSLSLHTSQLPLEQIWRERNAPPNIHSSGKPPQVYCVYRKTRFQVDVCCLNSEQTIIIEAAINRLSFSATIENLNQYSCDIAKLLFGLFEKRILCGISNLVD